MPTSDLPIGFLSGFFGWLSQKRIHGTNGERYIYLLIYLFKINPIHVGILYIYIYIYLIPMDPMAKKSHVEDSLPYALNPSSLEGFNLERLKFHGRVPGAESLRRYGPTTSSIAVESSGWRQENLQKESPCPSHQNLVSHTSQQKSLWQNGSGGIQEHVPFPVGIFQRNIHQNLIQLWDVVVSLPQKSIDLPYCPSLYQQQPSTRGSVTSCQPPPQKPPKGSKGQMPPRRKKNKAMLFVRL